MANVNEAIIEIEAGATDDATAREVYRNLQVLYGTTAGELALDRDFGIDETAPDLPLPKARALLVAEYVRKTQKYEPRATVVRVDWTNGNNREGIMAPKVVIRLV